MPQAGVNTWLRCAIRRIGTALLRVSSSGMIIQLFLVFVITPNVDAAGLSFGFDQRNSVTEGMIVSVSQEAAGAVERASVNNAQYVAGIAVGEKTSSVALDNGSASTIFVATTGTVNMYVSDVGGNIEEGDLISVSTIAGVGRKKARENTDKTIVAIAKSAFNSDTEGAKLFDLEHSGEVYIGLVRADVLLNEPFLEAAEDVDIVTRIGSSIVGKPVSLAQVMGAVVVVLAGMVISGAVLFGAIRGSLLSIGRNPLSANVIYSGMARVSGISVALMIIAIAAGYIVLLL